MTLHTFGCSITQGFALPDVVKPVLDDRGLPLSDDEVQRRGIHWSEIHLYQPSQQAWPRVLGDLLGVAVENHARRGSCFQQIARQAVVAAPTITANDTVIVMWTYLSRLSLQWPARTSVPFANIADRNWGWRTKFFGFNRFFGLEHSKDSDSDEDQKIQQYIESSTKNTYLDPMGTYNRYYNSLVLQHTVDGLLRSTGARVLHFSVEMEPVLNQLETARSQLPPSLRDPYKIPDPKSWYSLDVDYRSCYRLLDPQIPPAENDTHPSVTHHRNFAQHVYDRYFNDSQ